MNTEQKSKKRDRKSLFVLLMIVICLMIFAGCDFAIGPKTKTVYVVAHAGRPLIVLENIKVKARLVGGEGEAVTQDIGGWYAMPADHFERLAEAAGIK